MGDRPIKEIGYKTTLEAAVTPNMDMMAKNGICGIMDPIKPGIRPGSDTSHISILGYDPYKVYTGRGPFEAAGVGVDVLPGDIAFRCNFSTADDNGIIIDRRAGRIREGTEDLTMSINGMELDDVEVIFKESTGHRAVLVLRGEGLSDQISDADPKHDGNAPKIVVALDGSKEANKTANIVNKIVAKSYELLKDHPLNLKRINSGKPPANIIIPRGAGAVPEVQPFGEKYGLKPVCIAETGLIKGIAKIAGMELVDIEGATGGIDTNLENIKNGILETASKDFDFILINVDGADEAGHDGEMVEKIKFIEKVDSVVGELMKLNDVYFILTADHSTPISTMDHTGDPVPIVISGPEIRTDDVKYFNERSAAKGGLCRIRGNNIMDMLMDLMNLSSKFGA